MVFGAVCNLVLELRVRIYSFIVVQHESGAVLGACTILSTSKYMRITLFLCSK